MELIDRVMHYLHERRQNILDGNVNCIPSPLSTFRTEFIGIEQETYYIITGMQKAAKTKFTSYMFLYTPILYAYRNPEKVRVKIFYVPLEETKEKITMRFMVYLLFMMTNHQVRISQKELESTYEGQPVDEEILKMLETNPQCVQILDFFEKHVVFLESQNPTGIYKELVTYAAQNGKRIMRKITVKNQQTGEDEEIEKFDHYEPNDPNEYVEIIVDHISLITTESGMDLRASIKKLSGYLNEIRNKYKYIPVVIQQQSTETQNLDAYKNNKIRPTPAGLADCKDTAKDCNVMLGLTNPFAFEIPKYLGYDITRLRDCQRFLEVVLNRDGEGNGVKALYFDGAVSYFDELPAPGSEGYEDFMSKVYRLINRLKAKAQEAVSLFLFGIITKKDKDIRR